MIRQRYSPTLLALALAAPLYAQNNVKSIQPDTVQTLIQPGSTDKVTAERMNKGLLLNALDALSGQAAGVSVTSGGTDRMAMLNAVRVRGTTSLTGGNDPLVIIDGVSSDLSTLSTIYPADIESFTILKNASETARYGSRGASGVIEVATKRGTAGAFRIAYSGNAGFEHAYKTIDMLNGPDYLATAQNLGLPIRDGGHDTNFQRAITRTGFVQNHHLAFGGGSSTSYYRASLGYTDHQTIIDEHGSHSLVAKIDLTQLAFDERLKIDMGVFGSSGKDEFIFDEQKLFYSAATQNPTFANRPDASGNWDRNTTASQINPPGALIKERDDARNLGFNAHLKLEATLSDDWHAGVFGAYSFSSTENASFCPTWVWAQGQAGRGERKAEDYLANAHLDYGHIFGAHRLDVSLFGEYQRSERTAFWTLVKGFTTNSLGYDNLGGASTRPYGGTGSSYEAPSLASGMITATYALFDRYKLTASARADGSSMVAARHRWGLFPSLSAEWDVKREAVMQRFSRLNRLTLRAGYGASGNLGGISSYYSLPRMLPVGVVSVGGSPTVTMGTTSNVNPDLKWETRTTWNVGLDLGLWQGRFVMTAEWYYGKTTDMLYEYDVPVPPYPYSKLLANLGSMSNQGFELGLGVTPLKRSDMELNINVNLTWQRNKLISLSGDYRGTYITAPDRQVIGALNGAGFHGGNNNVVYQIVGQPLGVFYLPHCTGLVRQADGSYTYGIADLDGNGEINIEDGGDRYIAGQATPKVVLGSNIAFRYRRFDLSLQINGAFGHKIYNGSALTYMNMASFPDYNVMASAPAQNIKDQTATDYWLEKGDYLNFDYLTLGYNVPLSSSSAVKSLRLSVSVNNLATITAYSGLTPMINTSVVSGTLGLDDKRSYPPYRTWSMGVSLTF